MTHTVTAHLADVFNLTALAECLAHQRPAEYWESHTSIALAPPSLTHPLNSFMHAAAGNADLCHSALYRQLASLVAGSQLSGIPGTSWLAMKTLGMDARRYLFCDVDPAEGLLNTMAAGRELNIIDTKLECVPDDGIMLLRGACVVLPEQWTLSALPLLNPPDPLGETDAEITPLQLWCELANRAIPALLTYTFDSDARREQLHQAFAFSIDRTRIHSRTPYRFEGSQSAEGFGILTANLKDESLLGIDRHLRNLEKAFAPTLPWKLTARKG